MINRKFATAALLACLAPSALAAGTPEADALAHNAAYEDGTKFGTSPVTMSEMLMCAAVWDRWDYAVSSAADPKFTGSLRSELSSAHAKTRSLYWQRQARRQMTEDDDAAYFNEARGEEESNADEVYADYMNNEEGGMATFMEWLGIC